MKKTSWKKEVHLFIIILLGMILVTFFALNYRAFYQQFKYSRDNNALPINEPVLSFSRSTDTIEIEQTTLDQPTTLNQTTQEDDSNIIETGTEQVIEPEPAQQETEQQDTTTYINPESSQYRLIIPKISVDVPIAFAKNDSTEAVLDSLEEGVGLYPGSDMPGEMGRSVILGHSSRASWYDGEYAYIFSLLSNLELLDKFYFINNENKYTYQVFSKDFLSPDETNAILAGPSAPSEADLITCWPIGSASQRTLIRATLVGTEIL